uniref:Tachykinin-like peptides receptor 86C n=1 Tax=Cacopsylla melanoneura TaxID=428564 RepID=A0A8D8QMD3_9HEMI
MAEVEEEDDAFINCTFKVFEQDIILRNITYLWPINSTIMWTFMNEVIFNTKDSSLTLYHKNNITLLLRACLNIESAPHVLPWWQKMAWGAIFSLMLIVAIGGNIIVIWIVLAHRRMRTVTNYYLVNLSLADLFMAVFNCVFNFIYMLYSHWPFGETYCKVNYFITNITVAASVFTLVAISLDRYLAIMKPLQHRSSRTKARISLIIIWLASGLLALPCVLHSTTKIKNYSGGKMKIVCYIKWPDGTYPNSVSEYVYNLVFLLVTYLVPMFSMLLCYWVMGKELWGSQYIGERSQRQLHAIKSKRKVVKMFMIIITIFAICWLPYHGFFILVYHNNAISKTSYVQHMYLAFYWLAMANAMVNPVIYYWMNTKFKQYFQQIICGLCGLNSKKFAQQNIDLSLQQIKRGASQSDYYHSKSTR